MDLTIGIPKEILHDERRVAATPETAAAFSEGVTKGDLGIVFSGGITGFSIPDGITGFSSTAGLRRVTTEGVDG